MKRQSVLILGLIGMVASGYAASPFYKPNREAHLVVSLKSKSTYTAGDPIPVTVMLSNQSQDPILINARLLFNRYPQPGEISFTIEGPKKQIYPLLKIVTPQDVSGTDLLILQPGQTMERQVDLSLMYGVRHKGSYRVQTIYYNAVDLEKDQLRTWRGSLASEPTTFLVQ